MKIEPKQSAKRPHYAIALAAIASATFLTGCQSDGEVAIDGTASAPEIAEQTVPSASSEQEDEIVLGGEMAVYETTEAIGSDSETETEECEVGSRPLQLGGVVAMPSDDVPAEPLTLEGDVAWVPDYQEATDDAEILGTQCYAEAYAVAFAQADIPMKQTARRFSHYGTNFIAVLGCEDAGIELTFFDGSAADGDRSMREWLREVCTESYDWGCVLKTWDTCMVFADITAEGIDIAANAEQVVKDVIG